MPVILCTPQYRSSGRANVANTASGEEEPSNAVCEIAPASLKSDMCKHFAFSLSRNEKGGKVTGMKKTNMQTPPDCN